MGRTGTIIRESFNIMDQDADGYMNFNELVYALRLIGISTDYRKLYKNNKIIYNVKEYSKIARKELGEVTPHEKLIHTLKKLDKDNTGYLNVDTIIFLVMTMSNVLSDEDCSNFKKFVDPDNKSFISLENFAQKILS
ncbi:calmodulin, putative [Plasmodium knowlesi strain H]|uniref:Calmodulin, putative n=3 Tax=Plasmodium knowlesi TaxID=5850 RepID=A0A5E7X623_PLAKH|nr:calmodulin, putative [Plasmodium knowlesi strain H]OTN67686.1 putative Calmodulin [Plasmodium knowlesi]CAA9990422.1 calmodulin, putative [Plasmodium knowlesi strain H]SBO19628.1 calmodulin, putative [Plasmodium knowlesi strain H]SBO22575.1 calmodulin, putative [Plasmodium knowlesi strain H]VVS79896.1 calmodulin, putative [Plasmodium knowlesi strain H]